MRIFINSLLFLAENFYMHFLENIITELLTESADLANYTLVLPNKRPIVFMRKILSERGYSGLLPDFCTIEEIIRDISGKVEISGIALWLHSYEIYSRDFGDEDFATFLKWFPTLQKDWDDMLKFSGNSKKILDYMLAEERIKNWSHNLDAGASNALSRNLVFWRKMSAFLPAMEVDLRKRGWASPGMIHTAARENLEDYIQRSNKIWIFCGFNAFTPLEEELVRGLMQWDKAKCYFQADEYYLNDHRQEAGKFLRKYRKWKEFGEHRPFGFVEKEFSKPKSINVYEVSGNITQTKVLPQILESNHDGSIQDTAIVLLDENLLPASLDALSAQGSINITMGFALRNLAFSNAVKKLFYIQKQQEKKPGSFYYNDILAVLESLPNSGEDQRIVSQFLRQVQDRNMVYISPSVLQDLIKGLSYAELFKQWNVQVYLEKLINYCSALKFQDLDDIQYENISHFEKAFKTIKSLLDDYHFEVKMETLEALINQLVNLEAIDFEGQPLEGLQVMGLLETRLLNFKNIILLSVNEGKLPLGNSHNTYLPFDVRSQYNLHTFVDNDSIYAYHFYRLIQGAENVHLLYNALSSGVNTGEKSRFVTQLEMESPHTVNHIIIANDSEPFLSEAFSVEKSPAVLERLSEWVRHISASHLTAYLHNPAQFYLKYILKTYEGDEIEEELSQRNYGNIVHYALQFLYDDITGKILTVNDIKQLKERSEAAINHAIQKLNHQPEFYATGMNYVHKSIAGRVLEGILDYDLQLVAHGHKLEIIDLELPFADVDFKLPDGTEVAFHGYIDRIDRLDGTLRIIDYKTAKSKNLALQFSKKGYELFKNEDYKQALQLAIYLYYAHISANYNGHNITAGIWSFAEVGKGPQMLTFTDGSLKDAMESVAALIGEILDEKIPFAEKEHFYAE